jgi:hypothetical protein
VRRDAEFSELQCTLTPEQEELYDDAVRLWQVLPFWHACMHACLAACSLRMRMLHLSACLLLPLPAYSPDLDIHSTPRRTKDDAPVQDLRTGLHQALELTGAHSRDVWKPFWAAQQRFFKLLCISVKVPLPWPVLRFVGTPADCSMHPAPAPQGRQSTCSACCQARAHCAICS